MLEFMKVLFLFEFSDMQFVLRALTIQIWRPSMHSPFIKVSTDDSDGCHDIDFSALSFLRVGFTLETDVEVNEGSARDWLFTTRCM